MLTQAQLDARQGKLTASAVGALMSGDDTKVMNLWREMIGDPEFAREDLSDRWPIRLGETTEDLNLNWYEFKSGRKITRRGDVVVHPEYDWAAATLDGWVESISCPIECKHVGGFEPYQKIVSRYLPQMTWQMIVTESGQCLFSVIEGAKEPVVDVITYDAEYADQLWDRANWFMYHVRTLTPPVAVAPVPAPVKADRVYDMAGNNEFADSAATWLENVEAGKKAEKAEKNIKAMVPKDAQRAHGYGIEINRDRAGRLSLRVKKEEK